MTRMRALVAMLLRAGSFLKRVFSRLFVVLFGRWAWQAPR